MSAQQPARAKDKPQATRPRATSYPASKMGAVRSPVPTPTFVARICARHGMAIAHNQNKAVIVEIGSVWTPTVSTLSS
jgi:hypothetical protein